MVGETCPKCKVGKAYTSQTVIDPQAGTMERTHECNKCGHGWRERGRRR